MRHALGLHAPNRTVDAPTRSRSGPDAAGRVSVDDLAKNGASDEQLAELDKHVSNIHALIGADAKRGGSEKARGNLPGFANPSLARWVLPPALVGSNSYVDLGAAYRVFQNGQAAPTPGGLWGSGITPMSSYTADVHLPVGFDGSVQLLISGDYNIDEVVDEKGTMTMHRGMDLSVDSNGDITWKGETPQWPSAYDIKAFRPSATVEDKANELDVTLFLDASQSPQTPSLNTPYFSVPIDPLRPTNGHFVQLFKLKIIVDGKPAHPPQQQTQTPTTANASASAAAASAASAQAHASSQASATIVQPERRRIALPVPAPFELQFERDHDDVSDAERARFTAWVETFRARPDAEETLDALAMQTNAYVDVVGGASRPGTSAYNEKLSRARANTMTAIVQGRFGNQTRVNARNVSEDTSRRPDTNRHSEDDRPEQFVRVTVHAWRWSS